MGEGRGGKRNGAGRKQGSGALKKVSAEVINAGILPLEMRLMVARKLWADATDESGEIVDLDKAKAAADFAEAATQYTSPRLSAIAHSTPPGGKMVVEHRHRVSSEIKDLMAAESLITSLVDEEE